MTPADLPIEGTFVAAIVKIELYRKSREKL